MNGASWNSALRVAALLLLALPLAAAEPTITDRGPNHRTWQSVQEVRTPRGIVRRTNSFEEVSVGLHRQTDQGWVECDPKIELFQDGAVVRHLQYGVVFAPNLATRDAVDVLWPDGTRARNQILGLAYVEGDQSVLIAEVKDCWAEVGGEQQNELTYIDAFTDFAMSVRFVVKPHSFAQELLIHERLPGPQAYGLSDKAVLTLLTEFNEMPAVAKTTTLLRAAADPADVVSDEHLQMGAQVLAPGRAFTLGEEHSGSVPVLKSLEVIGGRTFLLEKIPWKQAEAELQKLPARRAALNPGGAGVQPAALAVKRGSAPGRKGTLATIVPARPEVRPKIKPIEMARPEPGDRADAGAARFIAGLDPRKGFLVDYEIVTSLTNFTFYANTNYYVSSPVTLSSTTGNATRMEGGTVIKFAPTNGASLSINGTLICAATNYRPITLTARDDHSIGAPIGTASLSGYYAANALYFNSSASALTNDLRYLRIHHAKVALGASPGYGEFNVSHAQIVNCQHGVQPSGTLWNLRNVLMHGVLTNFYTYFYSGDVRAEHLTVNQSAWFNAENSGLTNGVRLTNSLLVAVTNLGGGYLTGHSASVASEANPANIFQVVGAGSSYLNDDSAHRDVGATSINPSLAADLRLKTTYPPIVFAPNGSIRSNLVMTPRAARDTEKPDRGFHYDPLDYVFSFAYFTNSTVRAYPGTAIGTFSTGGGYGFGFGSASSFICEGDATNLICIARYNMAQEQATTNWTGNIGASFISPVNAEAVPPSIRFRFTDWSMPAADAPHFWGLAYNDGMPLSWMDSQFHGGQFTGSGASTYVTNCFFDRVFMELGQFENDTHGHFRNGLFRGGTLTLGSFEPAGYTLYDCVFDNVVMGTGDPVTSDYNGYTAGVAQLPGHGTHDVVLGSGSIAYEAGKLGAYYLPGTSPFLNAGSVLNAANSGFYHYTVTTNQTREGTSRLDIGFHYVAASTTTGLPTDMDSDGIADYLEDADGDGTEDIGESYWTVADSPYLPRYEPLGPSSRRTPLVISEIMYAPLTAIEFIELYNTGVVTQDISAFTFRTEESANVPTIPANTLIPPGGYFTLSLTNVGFLADAGDGLTLRNNLGAVLLDFRYSTNTPWPHEPWFTGHSLVLARPSYGENDPRAWAASERMGGSPGGPEVVSASPLRAIRINEYLANPPGGGGVVDYVELHNTSRFAVDVGGCVLSCRNDLNPNPPFSITNAPMTFIPPGGFMTFTGLQLQRNGEAVYLANPEKNWIIDSVVFLAQPDGISSGRYPSGSPYFSDLITRTPGTANSARFETNIVISEIMYNPLGGSGTFTNEYVELHNRGTTTENLSGWLLKGGIEFTLPAMNLTPGAYLVVANDKLSLMATYPNLTDGVTVVGSFEGKLGNAGDRVALLKNVSGGHHVMDEVVYLDGGRWGRWSDGDGASLELRHTASDNRQPYNWGDSQPPPAVVWTNLTKTALLEYAGYDTQLQVTAMQIIMLGEGECLIDDVQATVSGVNRITNPTLNANATGWTWRGNHDMSTWTNAGGLGDSGCLHLRSTGAGEYLVNHVRVSLSPSIPPISTVTIGANVRWLRGRPEILIRLIGNGIELGSPILATRALGTPAAANSIAVTNVGPAIWDISHFPILPAASQPVRISARVFDPDTTAGVVLKYRVDPSTTINTLTMVDNGTGADSLAGDGIFTTAVPGQSAGALVAFRVQATDALGATNLHPATEPVFPGDTVGRECLIRFGDPAQAGTLGIYRLWMTQATHNKWKYDPNDGNTRPAIHNSFLDVTFVYDDQRVIYNAGANFSGSEGISTYYRSPTTGPVCGYNFAFPKDEVFLGGSEATLDWPQADPTGLREVMTYWVARELGLPFNHRRYVRVIANGVQNSNRVSAYVTVATVYMDSQEPDSDFVNQWFPAAEDGELFKIHHYFSVGGWPVLPPGDQYFARLTNYVNASGQKQAQRYRWHWRHRAVEFSGNSYSNLFDLVDVFTNTANTVAFQTNVHARVDFEEWLRVLAFQRVIGNTDTYGRRIAHNAFAYWPGGTGLWQLLLLDTELTLGNGEGTANVLYDPDEAFTYGDPLLNKLMDTPEFERAFWRALKDAVEGPMLAAKFDAVSDAYHALLLGNGQRQADVNAVLGLVDNPSGVNNWVSARKSFIEGELAKKASPFEILTNDGQDFSTSDSSVTLDGKAPVPAKFLLIQGRSTNEVITWNTLTNWSFTLNLASGANAITLQGVDRFTNNISGMTDSITITRTP